MAIPGPVHDGPPPGDALATSARPATTPLPAPDLVGLETAEARSAARALGLRLSFVVWETKIGPWGMVLEQQPTPGTPVRRGTRLHVVVSARPLVRVPDLRGWSEEAADETLRRLGFVRLSNATRADEALPDGHVASTVPAGGALVAYGSVVTLNVAAPEGTTPW